MATPQEERQARVEQYDHWATRRGYGAQGPNNPPKASKAC
jgi:hypothetical protein